MKFLSSLTTALCIPVVSFLPAGIISTKNIDLKWAVNAYPALKFDVYADQYTQAKGKAGLRMYDWKILDNSDGSQPYDISFGALNNVGGADIKEINTGITSVPFKFKISGTTSPIQTKELFDGQTILLKDIANSNISNKDEILRSFYRTCPDEFWIRNDEDWYLHPENHMGTDRGDWNCSSTSCGNPTNMYDFNAKGQWLDKGGVWTDRCQGLQESDKGSNGKFKCWLWELEGTPTLGDFSCSCNVPNSESKDVWSRDFLYKRGDNWKKAEGYMQSESVYNFVKDEIIDDSRSLNVNKWCSWDDSWCPQIISFMFNFKNFFDCIEVSLTKNVIPPKKIEYTLHFKYNSSLLNGTQPFSFYLLMLGPHNPLDATERHEIYCFHPTANDFGGICTDRCHGWQRGTMCGIYTQGKYNNTDVNPSIYTWSTSGSFDIKNPLIEK